VNGEGRHFKHLSLLKSIYTYTAFLEELRQFLITSQLLSWHDQKAR